MTITPVKRETNGKIIRDRKGRIQKGSAALNPDGAPKRDASMAEAYKWALSLNPEVIVQILTLNGNNDLARQFKQMPQGIQLKILFALRVMAAAMFEPNGSLLNHIVDRIDGPVEPPPFNGELIVTVNYADSATATQKPTGDQE